MKIELNGKEYNIKFGYKPTLKERIISKVVKLGDVTGENDEVDLYWKGLLPSYYKVKTRLPILYNNMKLAVKEHIKSF